MAIPSRSEAERIFRSHDPPEWLVVHSRGVSRVAAEAARLLAANGEAVDPQLAEVAGLLHDIDKLTTRESGEPHGEVAARWLTELGFAELADAVAAHPVWRLLEIERFPDGWAPVVVQIADRHVADVFMTIDQRLDSQIRRHPAEAAEIEPAREPAHAMEARLAAATGLTVDELVEALRRAADTP